MDATREVFSNAPLAMVVAEIQFSYLPELSSEAALAQALGMVRSRTPVMEPTVSQRLGITFGPEASATQEQRIEGMSARSLDKQVTAAVTPRTLNVAMSGAAYTRFEDSLRPLIQAAYDGLRATVPDVIVTRIGLRYLDEVRVPDATQDIASWKRWISPDLLGPSTFLTTHSGVPVGSVTTWQYRLPSNQQVVFTCGPFLGVGIVGPEHPFHKGGTEQLMYVLDLDSSWTPVEGAQSLTDDELLARYDELHKPGQEIFSRSVTDDARELFRRGTA